MLINRATACSILSVALIAFVTVNGVPARAASPAKVCQEISNSKASNGRIGGRASLKCPPKGEPQNQQDTGKAQSKSSSTKMPAPSHTCNPRLDPDCIGSLIPVSTGGSGQPSDTELRKVAVQLSLPDPTPRFGPDPSVNKWKMLAVGYPIWLWTDRPTTISTTAHHDGLTFTLTATWTSTTFTMGDGHTKTCTATTIRPKTVKPATKPSPTCGYVYQTKSSKGHPYTVTAATHWHIDWTTNGYNGTFTHTYTGNRTLNIGELQSLING